MTGEKGLSLSWPMIAFSAVVLVGIGAAAAWTIISRPVETGPLREAVQSEASRAATASGAAAPSETTITLTPDAIERAGIVVAPVESGESPTVLRVPAMVEPNAYHRVTVTPLIGGRVTRVAVALGDRVRRGQHLAELYSPELANAQTDFVALSADLEAAHQRLLRIEKLVEIGSASRQELETTRAEHTSHTVHVESARSKLLLLGLTPDDITRLTSTGQIDSTTHVPAPIDGIITERDANVGLNVDPAMKLFTVADLSTVWVVGNLYERDFGAVQIGSAALMTTSAFPDLRIDGRVSYIDPQVSLETRTAQVRVEVPNPGGRLRLGMYAELQITTRAAGPTMVIPKAAVQNVADLHMVYAANAATPGRFVERSVQVGRSFGDRVEVLSGLQPGDSIVKEGSFFLRAERERLGLRPGGSVSPDPPGSAAAAPAAGAPPQVVRVIVSELGYEPATLKLRAGVPARITFTRTTDKTCGTEVLFPSLNIKRALPLNQPVDIDFTPSAGEIGFVCGMNMLRGTIIAQ